VRGKIAKNNGMWSYHLPMQIANPPPTGTQSSPPVVSAHFLSSAEGELALTVIGFGAMVIIAFAIVLRSKAATPELALRCFIITMIITGTLFLICAGYTNDQIAPAIGLFGTIAGYLLGKSEVQR
jgi:hypothetical protein